MSIAGFLVLDVDLPSNIPQTAEAQATQSDGLECTGDTCSGGDPVFEPLDVGTACGTGGELWCNGTGQCVGCVAPEACGMTTACVAFTCTDGECGAVFEDTGTPVSDPIDGDCQAPSSDGNGATQAMEDNTDVPEDDGNQCTQDLCEEGPPRTLPWADTGCDQAGGTVCSGESWVGNAG